MHRLQPPLLAKAAVMGLSLSSWARVRGRCDPLLTHMWCTCFKASCTVELGESAQQMRAAHYNTAQHSKIGIHALLSDVCRPLQCMLSCGSWRCLASSLDVNFLCQAKTVYMYTGVVRHGVSDTQRACAAL